jgi:hypothetical protein
VCSNARFALFLYNYCLFVNTKVRVVSVSARGEAVVAPGAHLLFLIVVGIIELI